MSLVYLKPTFLRNLLSLALALSILAPAPKSHADGLRDCARLLLPAIKSENQLQAEKILSQYRPFDQVKVDLEVLSERSGVSVFQATHPDYPGQSFVLKVTPLSEAFNDYYALQVLRKAQAQMDAKIKVIDSVLLIPRSGEVTLNTKVIQKNPYVKGPILADVLADPSVLTERKIDLRRKYKAYVDELQKVLLDQGYDAYQEHPHSQYYRNQNPDRVEEQDFIKSQPRMLKATHPWRSITDPFAFERGIDPFLVGSLDRLSGRQLKYLAIDGEDVMILIKSDNFVVGPDDQLILFDPF